MEYTEVINSISTVGFPIVACYFMYKFSRETIDRNTQATTELSKCVAELKTMVETIMSKRED